MLTDLRRSAGTHATSYCVLCFGLQTALLHTHYTRIHLHVHTRVYATAGDLLDSVRSQLDIDEARAAEVQRLLGLVSSSMRDQAGVGLGAWVCSGWAGAG